jgi:hypothetical protein
MNVNIYGMSMCMFLKSFMFVTGGTALIKYIGQASYSQHDGGFS